MSKTLNISPRNLMDKEISVDEEMLDTPLEPLKYPVNNIQNDIYVSCKNQVMENVVTLNLTEESTNPKDKFTSLLLENSECHSKMHLTESNLIGDRNITSILRRQSYNYEQSELCATPSLVVRKVSFPSDEQLVTYREPEFTECWNISKKKEINNNCDFKVMFLYFKIVLDKSMTSKEILQEYENSCKRHKTIELDVLKGQLIVRKGFSF